MKKTAKSLMLGLMCLGTSVMAADDPGKAIDWSGNGDYIKSSYNGVGGNAARTFETWAQFDNANNRPLFGEGDTGATGITVVQNGGTLRLEVGSTATVATAVTVNSSPETWYHVAFTVKPNTTTAPTNADLVFYLNGEIIGSYTDVALDTTNTKGLYVGNGAGGEDNVWDGSIDETRYWSVALTQNQIKAAASGLATTDGSNVKFGGIEEAGLNWSDLELYFTYDTEANKATAIIDRSENAHTQTAPGGSSWTFIDFNSFAFSPHPNSSNEITAYDSLANVDAGYAINPTYVTNQDVLDYLNANVTSAVITGSTPSASTPIVANSWAAVDSYDSSVANSYTFRANLDTANLPTGYVDNDSTITTVDIEVVVASGAPDVNVTAVDVADETVTVTWDNIVGVDHYVVNITKGDGSTADLSSTTSNSQVITFAQLDLDSAVDPDLSNKGFDPLFLPFVVRSENSGNTELSNSAGDTSLSVNGEAATGGTDMQKIVYLGKTANAHYVTIGSGTFNTIRSCVQRLVTQYSDGAVEADIKIKRSVSEPTHLLPIYNASSGDANYDADYNTANSVHNRFRDLNWKNNSEPLAIVKAGDSFDLSINIKDNKSATGNQQNSSQGYLWVDWNNDGDFDDANETITSDYKIGIDLNNDGVLDDKAVTANSLANYLTLLTDSVTAGTFDQPLASYEFPSELSSSNSAAASGLSRVNATNSLTYSQTFKAGEDLTTVHIQNSDSSIVPNNKYANPLWIKRTITVPAGTPLGKVRARMRYGFNEPANAHTYGRKGGNNLNGLLYDFEIEVSTVTPAIGVKVTQTGTLVEWTVEDERDVKEYQLVDADGNVLETVVAKGLDSYSVTLDEFTVVELVVVDNDGSRQTFTPTDGNEVTTTYNLVEGWNLIATIGDYTDLSKVEDATIGTIWAWDGNKYVATDAQDANQGIWVYAPVAKTVKATAIKAGATLILQPGWTLTGPSNNVDAPADAVVFSWTTKYNEIIEKANALIQGQGYWFFVTEETEIDVNVK